MVQVSYHKVHRWRLKRFKVVGVAYYDDGYISVIMSK